MRQNSLWHGGHLSWCYRRQPRDDLMKYRSFYHDLHSSLKSGNLVFLSTRTADIQLPEPRTKEGAMNLVSEFLVDQFSLVLSAMISNKIIPLPDGTSEIVSAHPTKSQIQDIARKLVPGFVGPLPTLLLLAHTRLASFAYKPDVQPLRTMLYLVVDEVQYLGLTKTDAGLSLVHFLFTQLANMQAKLFSHGVILNNVVGGLYADLNHIQDGSMFKLEFLPLNVLEDALEPILKLLQWPQNWIDAVQQRKNELLSFVPARRASPNALLRDKKTKSFIDTVLRLFFYCQGHAGSLVFQYARCLAETVRDPSSCQLTSLELHARFMAYFDGSWARSARNRAPKDEESILLAAVGFGPALLELPPPRFKCADWQQLEGTDHFVQFSLGTGSAELVAARATGTTQKVFTLPGAFFNLGKPTELKLLSPRAHILPNLFTAHPIHIDDLTFFADFQQGSANSVYGRGLEVAFASAWWARYRILRDNIEVLRCDISNLARMRRLTELGVPDSLPLHMVAGWSTQEAEKLFGTNYTAFVSFEGCFKAKCQIVDPSRLEHSNCVSVEYVKGGLDLGPKLKSQDIPRGVFINADATPGADVFFPVFLLRNSSESSTLDEELLICWYATDVKNRLKKPDAADVYDKILKVAKSNVWFGVLSPLFSKEECGVLEVPQQKAGFVGSKNLSWKTRATKFGTTIQNRHRLPSSNGAPSGAPSGELKLHIWNGIGFLSPYWLLNSFILRIS
eukprot:TRINITY_DN736_c0_g2_i5.p1 TRINITY_DN736_c0_g2~~TRINITY_DN736_c0_g2_i5.p1  ORF type:complete len:734 (+),score=89.79 TRINITY_DN736_c0_g2_i5:1296-3497(+)